LGLCRGGGSREIQGGDGRSRSVDRLRGIGTTVGAGKGCPGRASGSSKEGIAVGIDEMCWRRGMMRMGMRMMGMVVVRREMGVMRMGMGMKSGR